MVNGLWRRPGQCSRRGVRADEGDVVQPGFDVDERLLQNVAKSVDDAAATLQTAVQAAGSGLAPPPGSGAAAAAAKTVEQRWLADLGRLQRETEAFAADLVVSAKDYQATDQLSAAGLRAAGNGAPR
jgi:uncharacterized protein YukE